jgi:hypothetical protein
MSERWSTPEQITAARLRLESAIPDYQEPTAYGAGRLHGDGVEFFRVNTSVHRLPAAVLATVCGHVRGSASYLVGLDTFERAIEMLSPAEADTSQPHPNLWAWRQARTSLAENDRIVVVFDADPSTASDDRFVLALRAAVDRAGT